MRCNEKFTKFSVPGTQLPPANTGHTFVCNNRRPSREGRLSNSHCRRAAREENEFREIASGGIV